MIGEPVMFSVHLCANGSFFLFWVWLYNYSSFSQLHSDQSAPPSQESDQIGGGDWGAVTFLSKDQPQPYPIILMVVKEPYIALET